MKKITILGLFLLGLLLLPLSTSADVIPTGMHSVNRCFYITNLSDFSDIYVIESSESGTPGNTKTQNTLVKNDKCLHSDSLYFQSEFFIVNKNYIDSIGLENFVPTKNNIVLEKVFDHYGRYVSDTNPVLKQSINYLLVKNAEGNFVLQKDKVISTYSNNIKDLLPPIFIFVGLVFLIIFFVFIIIKIKKRKIKENQNLINN